LCVTLTWEDPRGDITTRALFAGSGTKGESGKGGVNHKTSFMTKMLGSDGTEQEAEKGLAQLQRVTVAHGDQRQLEGDRHHFSPGDLGKQEGVNTASPRLFQGVEEE